MAYVKINHCYERKGMLRVLFSFYLDKGEARFNEHEAIHPETGLKIVNPFHNHFAYVEPDITNEELLNMGESLLQEAYSRWAVHGNMNIKNNKVKFPAIVSTARKRSIENRAKALISSERRRLV